MADLVKVDPVALLPTQAGCAVFLGDGSKAIVFYIEPAIGASINAALAGQQPPRPLTHDLFVDALRTLGAEVQRILIVKVEDDVFYARLFLQAENEIMEKKIIELDARPSDCIALAVRQSAPLYVLKSVWDELKDMTPVLEELRDKGMELEGED
ncbi:MAG: bifunctional nuclease family protein [Akkermansiaceae bacterium]|nr:bifunctional nuclease family protein [Akkermansiaceae bacterium]NNM29214.1 bifunctional nuclease family protein [Akkermansiaceae bacterium]